MTQKGMPKAAAAGERSNCESISWGKCEWNGSNVVHSAHLFKVNSIQFAACDVPQAGGEEKADGERPW